jgi:hypothetical protein
MTEQSFQQVADDEVSIKDVVDFFVESWRAIITTGVIGALVPVPFLMVTPSQYEATAQIRMAQISNKTDFLGSIVESPSSLIGRYQLPSAFAEDEIKACSPEGKRISRETLSKLAKFTSMKGSDSIVELKITLASRDGALACAHAIFENIKEYQTLIIKPYIEDAKSLLIKYQIRLQENQALVARADKSGSAFTPAFFANVAEAEFLFHESARLNVLISSVDRNHARLVLPVYVSDLPASPRKSVSLGLLVGLFVGALLALLRKAWSRYKASNH